MNADLNSLDRWKGAAERWLPKIRTMYEDLHRIPELSLKEYKTTEYICSKLREMNIEPHKADLTGCYAWLGPEVGPVLALRADIDGLPVAEETGLEYASTHEGQMHACGHDGHMAILLGVAGILKEMEKECPVRVKLIFQASEENAQGAARLIDKGILNDVDRIFGVHLFSDIPTGLVSLEDGPRMAQTDRFEVTFYGKGGHAAKPHLCTDATLMAAEYVTLLQSVVARETNPAEAAVVSVGSLHSGNQYNIISGEARMEGTCRCYSGEMSGLLEEGLRRRAEGIAACHGGKAELVYQSACHPPVVNDPEMTTAIRNVAEAFLGKKAFGSVKPLLLGEDFSWYQSRIPGVFAFVGCGKPDQPVWPNHHCRFRIDENALLYGVFLHLSAVLGV